MAITRGNISNSGDPGTVQPSYSWNHTCQDGTNLLVVCVAVHEATDADRPVNGVTYNGLALTEAVAWDDTTANDNASVWYRKDPPTGSLLAIQVTHEGKCTDTSAYAVDLKDVDLTSGSIDGVVEDNYGNSATTTGLALTCSTGDVVVGCATADEANLANMIWNTGDEIGEVDCGAFCGHGGYNLSGLTITSGNSSVVRTGAVASFNETGVTEVLAGQANVTITASGVLDVKRAVVGQADVSVSTSAVLQAKFALANSPPPMTQLDNNAYGVDNGWPHALVHHNGFLYYGCIESPGRVLKIDENDLSSFSAVEFTDDGNHDSVADIVYSATNDKLYALCAESGRLVIVEIDPDTLADSDVINTTSYSAWYGSLEVDSSYLYVVTNIDDKILKYDLSDWSLDDSATLTKETPHALEFDGTNLYATTQNSPADIVKIDPTDLSVQSSATFAAGENWATDDFALTATHAFVGCDVAPFSGRIMKVQKSDLSITYIDTGIKAAVYDCHYDGTWVWVAYASGYLARIDPTTNDVTVFVSPASTPNEIVNDGEILYVSSYLSNGQLTKISSADFFVTIRPSASLDVARELVGQSDLAVSTTALLRVIIALIGQPNIAVATTAQLAVKKEIVGQADIALTASGSLSVKSSIVGQADVSVSTVANLGATLSITGQSDVALTSTASLGLKILLLGQADISITATGSLDVKREIAGQSDITVSTTGVLGIKRGIAGQADIQVTSAAVLDVKRGISGQSDIQISATGTVDFAGVTEALQGQSDIAIAASGAVEAKRGLAGQSDVTVSTTSALSRTVSLAGQANIVLATTASLSVAITLQTDLWQFATTRILVGQSDIAIATSGTLSVKRCVAGSSAIQLTTAGAIEVLYSLAGQADVQISTVADLAVAGEVTLQGTAAVAIATTANLTYNKASLKGQSDAVVGATANLSITAGLIGAAAVTLTVSGTLGVKRAIAGQADIAISTTGSLSVTKGISGQSDIIITTTSELSVGGEVTLQGQSVVSLTATGALSVTYSLAGQANVVISTTAALSVGEIEALVGSAAISISTAAVAGRQRAIIGSADVQISTTGVISITISIAGQSDIVISSTGAVIATRQLVGTSDITVGLISRLTAYWALQGVSGVQILAEGTMLTQLRPAWLASVNLTALNSIMGRT